jgi:hypothetical protein
VIVVELRRPLGATEEGIWLMDAAASLNFVIVCHVSGALKPDELRQGLDAAQARHPQLRARVEELPEGPAFTPVGVGPIPLEVKHLPEQAWVAEAEDQLPLRFPLAGPYLRATLLRHDAGLSTLLLGFHHVIADGRGAMALVRDVLTAAAGARRGVVTELEPSLDVLPFDARLPADCFGWRAALRRGVFALRVLCRSRLWGPPVRVRRDREAFAHSRRTRVIPTELKGAQLQRLVDRCRAEETTVHGALSAAMLLGILADRAEVNGVSSKVGPVVTMGRPVNQAQRLRPPPGDALGLHVFTLDYETRLSQSTGFWELARDVHDSLHRGLARKDDLCMAVLNPKVAGWMGARTLDPKQFLEKWEQNAFCTTSLTNLGRTEIPSIYGSLGLEACRVVSTPSALGDFMASAVTLGDTLYWTFLWPDPVLTEEHAQRLTEGIASQLHRALDL